MNRSLKKFIYGLFYFVCLGLIVFLFTRPLFKAAPTCSDNIMNQNETGIDCGGNCVACAEKNLSPLTVQAHRVFSLSTGQSTILFGVANPNNAYHAAGFDYHVDVFDKGGTKIERFDGRSSLYANESKYMLEPRVSARFDNIGEVAISLDNPEWRSIDEFAAPKLSVSGIVTDVLPEGSIRVSGTASNISGNTAREVTVLAVAHDRYNAKIFASETVITSLVGFQNASFTIPFPIDPIFKNVDAAKTEMFISSR